MITQEHEEKFQRALTFLQNELNQLRTNRAQSALIEHIKVSAYDVETPIHQLASIHVPDIKTITIQPWDKSILSAIEKALRQSDIGIQPIISGDLIRLSFPPLTEERRKEIVKLVHSKGEETKIRIKNIREQILKEWKELEKNGDISEDELEIRKKKLQEKIDDIHDTIKEFLAKKEKDVMEI